MIKIAICDDEQIVVEEIKKILQSRKISVDEEFIIEQFTSGVDLFAKLEKGECFDLIFLDVEMPELTGLQLSQKIRNSLNDKKTQIAYISAKSEYAMNMLNFAPLRFIQKNQTADELISKIKICEAIDYLIELKNQTEDHYAYTLECKHYRIKLKDILYFSSDKRKIIIHGKYETVSFYKSFKELEKETQENPAMKYFIKCNRGLIVNGKYCQILEGLNLTLADGTILPVSIIDRNKVKALLFGGN